MKLNSLNHFPLFEATRDFQHKMPDPALLTFDEFYKLVNPSGKSHSSEAYETSIENLNNKEYLKIEGFPKLLNTFRRQGIVFELRESVLDRWELDYVKTDPETGWTMRDQNGDTVYYSKDELSKLIPEAERFQYEHAIVDKDRNLLVGLTQDEWGALLIRVASEYQGFGLGKILRKANLARHSVRDSGGYTPQGKRTIRAVHADAVREYMRSGFYTHLVKQGTITKDRVWDIISSIPQRGPKQPEKNLNMNDPRDWLLMTDEDSHAIIYDRKIYDLLDDDPRWDYWVEQAIKGMISLGSFGTSDHPFVSRISGSDRTKAYLLELVLNFEIGGKIRLDPDEAVLVQRRIGDALHHQPTPGPSDPDLYWIEGPTMKVAGLGDPERRYRKQHDQYDEIYHRIMELADAQGNPAHSRSPAMTG